MFIGETGDTIRRRGGASPSPTVLGCRYLTDKSKFEHTIER